MTQLCVNSFNAFCDIQFMQSTTFVQTTIKTFVVFKSVAKYFLTDCVSECQCVSVSISYSGGIPYTREWYTAH